MGKKWKLFRWKPFLYYIMIMNDIENKFEELSILASKNNWCWRMPCTTCGCSNIIAGFYAIAYNIDLSSGNIDSIIRREDFRILDYSSATKVIESVSDANVDVIKKQCKFPDWLGYIGLIYWFVVPIVSTKSSKELSKSLCAQFISMLHPNTNAYKSINTIIKSNYSKSFHIGILEQIENDMLLKKEI